MHSFDQKYIELLAEKKLKGSIVAEEQILLDQWLKRKAPEQMSWFSEAADEEALKDRLFNRIKGDAGISFSERRLIKRPFQWVAAAAILFLMIGSLGYLFLFSKERFVLKVTNREQQGIHDIAPGHRGAILTLANGEKIILDSADNGPIVFQGSRQLMKKDGQLVYEKAKAKLQANNNILANEEVNYNTLTTPRGRVFGLVLADGSKVWLNAASSITYPTSFVGKKREVSVKGEVYFEVEKDSKYPFVVSVGNAEITVLGTHFDVMAYPNEKVVKTTLLEGAVKVTHNGSQVIMESGQQASFSGNSGGISLEDIDTSGVVAWTAGSLSMNNLDLGAIMRRISRWYDVDVEFTGPIPEDHYWGIINRNVNLSEMLKVLRANGLDASLKDSQVIVRSKR